MERIVSKGDDLVVDVQPCSGCSVDIQPVQRFEFRVICSVLEVLVTARAGEFCNSWRRNIFLG